MARTSRRADTRRMQLTATHHPTGIAVSEEIPEGHYSRKEMQRLRRDLEPTLLAKLEKAVAAHLRIPGRSN